MGPSVLKPTPRASRPVSPPLPSPHHQAADDKTAEVRGEMQARIAALEETQTAALARKADITEVGVTVCGCVSDLVEARVWMC